MVLGSDFKFHQTLKLPKQDDLNSQFNVFFLGVDLNTLICGECSINKDDYSPWLYIRLDWDRAQDLI